MSETRLWNASFSATSVLVYAVLLIPILTIVVTSFTQRSFPTIPYDGVTLKWYVSLFRSETILSALATSLLVATIASLLSTLIGTVAAFGFVRGEFPFKETFATLMLLPLMISPVITGLALIRYTNQIGLSWGILPIVIGHSILTLPFVFLIVRAELATFDKTLEQASRVLGAGPVESVVNVTLPNISSAVISATLISFVVSFGEFTATQFLVSPGTTTVPVIIYTKLRSGLTPDISALSTLLVAVMFTAAVVSAVVQEQNTSVDGED